MRSGCADKQLPDRRQLQKTGQEVDVKRKRKPSKEVASQPCAEEARCRRRWAFGKTFLVLSQID